jgi:hypothetical protein
MFVLVELVAIVQTQQLLLTVQMHSILLSKLTVVTASQMNQRVQILSLHGQVLLTNGWFILQHQMVL